MNMTHPSTHVALDPQQKEQRELQHRELEMLSAAFGQYLPSGFSCICRPTEKR
jgi:hypothetical protein